jgi:hypothetical protein
LPFDLPKGKGAAASRQKRLPFLIVSLGQFRLKNLEDTNQETIRNHGFCPLMGAFFNVPIIQVQDHIKTIKLASFTLV